MKNPLPNLRKVIITCNKHPRTCLFSILIVVLLSMFALMLWEYNKNSPTEDEWAHITRGISYWQSEDTRLLYSHPPLANALDNMINGFDSRTPNLSESKGWKTATVSRVALDYIRKDYPLAREQMFRARIINMMFALFLCVYAFFWCRKIYNLPVAFAALLLLAFNPIIIGQARYVTTDLVAGVMSFFAIAEFIRFLLGQNPKISTWLMPLSLGIALISKHSCVLLVPILFLIGFGASIFQKGLYVSFSRKAALKHYLLQSIMTAFIVIFTINAAYRFEGTMMRVDKILEAPEPQFWVTKKYKHQMLEKLTPLQSFPEGLRIPLPYTYMFGIIAVRAQNEGGFLSYFMGKPIREGHPLYFPTVLAIKNTPAVVLLLLLGAVFFFRKVKYASLQTQILCIVGGALLLFMMSSKLNMGIRHAMPIVPVLSVLAAVAFGAVRKHFKQTLPTQPILQYVFVGLLLTTIPSAAFAGPSFLGYYNFFVGGRENGHQINIYGDDWGQDRVRVAEYVKQNKLQNVYYHTQSQTRKVEIDYHDFEYTPLQCKTQPPSKSWAIVHALPAKIYQNRCFKFRDELEPYATIHDHVYIYKIP